MKMGAARRLEEAFQAVFGEPMKASAEGDPAEANPFSVDPIVCEIFSRLETEGSWRASRGEVESIWDEAIERCAAAGDHRSVLRLGLVAWQHDQIGLESAFSVLRALHKFDFLRLVVDLRPLLDDFPRVGHLPAQLDALLCSAHFRLQDLGSAVQILEGHRGGMMRCDGLFAALFRTVLDCGDRRLSERARNAIIRCTGPLGSLWEVRIDTIAGDFDSADRRIDRLLKSTICEREFAEAFVVLLLDLGRYHDIVELSRRKKIFERLSARTRSRTETACAALEYVADETSSSQKDIRFPDALFEVICKEPIRSSRVERSAPLRIAMVNASMVARGAESILASTFDVLAEDPDLQCELWLQSRQSELGHDFFLRGLEENHCGCVRLIGFSEGSVRAPFGYFSPKTAAGIGALHEALLREKPDLVHGWNDIVNVELATAALTAGIPKIILHAHNMRPELVHRHPLTRSLKGAYRAALRWPHVHLVCNCEAALNDYLTWLYREPGPQFHVVENGFPWKGALDLQEWRIARATTRLEFGIGESEPLVGGVFRLVPVKRPALWIETAAHISRRRPDVRFLLFGEGPELGSAKRHAERLGLSETIQFAGTVSDAPQKMAAFDILLHASASEALPSVVIEAQANAVPIVTTRVGGLDQCLISPHSIVVDSEAADELAEGVMNLLGRRISLDSLAVPATEIRGRFAIETMTQKLKAIYLA